MVNIELLLQLFYFHNLQSVYTSSKCSLNSNDGFPKFDYDDNRYGCQDESTEIPDAMRQPIDEMGHSTDILYSLRSCRSFSKKRNVITK